MEFYLVNTGFILLMIITYFTTQLCSIKTDRVISMVFLLAFLCMIAVRPNTVRDTFPYIDLFNYMDSYQFRLGLGRHTFPWGSTYEIGFSNLCKLSSLLSSSYQFFFFIVALLTVGAGTSSILLISSSIYNVPNTQYRVFPALLLFVSYYGFMYSGIVLRAGLAISFCLLSYAMIFKRHYLFALMAYILAFSFHNSALIFLIVFIVYISFPVMRIRTYRIIALSIIGLYIARFFDLFQGLIVMFARQLASHISFLNFLDSYLFRDFRDSGFLKTILFFMAEFVYLTFCFTETISNKQKRNLNVIMMACIAGGLFGFFPAVVRGLDVLFIVIIPSLYCSVLGIGWDDKLSIANRMQIRKQTIRVIGIGLISLANFLLFSRWAGYLELIKETILR